MYSGGKIDTPKMLFQVGPGFYEKWMYWASCSNEQKVKAAVKSELERILLSEVDHKALLTFEEITTVSTSESHIYYHPKGRPFYLVTENFSKNKMRIQLEHSYAPDQSTRSLSKYTQPGS